MFTKESSVSKVRLLRPLWHMILVLVAYFVVYRIRTHTDMIPFMEIWVPYMDSFEIAWYAFMIGVIFVLFGFVFGLYSLSKPVHNYYIRFLKWWFYTLMAGSFVSYFGYEYIFQAGIPRLIILWGAIFMLVILTVFDIFYNKLIRHLQNSEPYEVLVIYKNQNDFDELLENFEKYDNYELEGLELKDTKLTQKLLDKLEGKSIAVLLGSYDRGFMQEVLDYCRLEWKKFYHIFESFFLEDLVYQTERFGPVIGFEYKPSPLDGWYRVFKRVFDIVFSIVFLIFFWWLYILVAVFIIIKDGRPFIYKSKRVGKKWKLFEIYKFRSMVKNADKLKDQLKDKDERGWPLFKISDDPRVPAWWAIIRKTSIDEIPQVFNILKWEMSWVGPRPHLKSEVDKYEKWQKRLLSIKPWLTGYAQIFGRDKLSFSKEAKLDLYYIQNRSLLFDIYVIITTLKVVFSGK